MDEQIRRALDLSQGERCIVVDWPLEGGAIYLAAQDHVGVKAIENFPLAQDGSQIVEQLLLLDEASARLWENFQKMYPVVSDHFLGMSAPKETFGGSMGYLLWIVSALLWLDQEEIDAATSLTKVGLKVDTKLIKDGVVAKLDTPRVLRSLLSYKIAGVGNATLLFSLYESLADFIIESVELLNETFSSRVVVLLGDVASHGVIKERIEHRMGRRLKLIWG